MKRVITTICFTMVVMAAMAQSPFSFHAKAGVGTSNFWGKHSSSETKIAYKMGVGAEYALTPTWVLQSALEFISIGGKKDLEHIGKADMTELYLQLPLMMAARLNLNKDYHISLSAGPYIACGVGGKTSGEAFRDYGENGSYRFKLDTFGSMQEQNMGNKWMDAGIAIGLNFEYHKFIFGADVQMGLVRVNEQINQMMGSPEGRSYLPKNFASFFTLGYRFF